jgi:lipopolysaccharide transport system permease protein
MNSMNVNSNNSGENPATNDDMPITLIKSESLFQAIDFKELWEYRDLFLFLVWRNVKVLYAQTILGFLWAIINPFVQIIIFTIIFGKVAKLDTGDIPYTLFLTVAIVPWTYMSGSMTASSQSLVSGQGMLGKVYFPRLIFPVTPVFSKLIDFGISILLVVAVMIYYGINPNLNLIFLPLFLIMMVLIPIGIGLWVSSLAIRYRDVRFAMPFFLNMLIYSAPILYSAEKIPEAYRFIYSLNPIVSVVEGYRACLLGTAMPWEYIIPGFIVSIILVVSGAFYFKRMERIVVDVI